MINLTLGESNFQVIKFNQYDKNYTFDIKLTNYTPIQGDIYKIEWVINNKVAVIQSTDITVNDNILTVKLLREVTLNAGKGYFNVVVDNLNNNSRKATFKSEFEVVGNSIDEDTVSSVLVETVLEKLRNEEINANEVLTNLLNAISTGDIDKKLNKAGDKMSGALVMANNRAIQCAKTTGANINAVMMDNNDVLYFGSTGSKTMFYSSQDPRVRIGSDTNFKILYHQGNKNTLISDIKVNLLNLFYPIGSIKLTADNVNPSTTLGGTWTSVGTGEFIVGAGTGTDKNGVSKTFSSGSNDGEYENTFTHKHQTNGTGLTNTNSVSGSCIVGTSNYTSEETITLNNTPPSYGLYIWKRTA